MIHYINPSVKPVLPVKRLPSATENKTVLIYGAGKTGRNFYKQIRDNTSFTFLGFIDRLGYMNRFADQFIEEQPVYKPSEVSSLQFDYIFISEYRYQDEILKILQKNSIYYGKIIQLERQDFTQTLEEPDTKYEFNSSIAPDTAFCDLDAEALKWYRGNYKDRCMFADQHLSELLMLDLDFVKSNVLYHIIDRDMHYIGSISRKVLKQFGSSITEGEPMLSEVCDRLLENGGIDKGISMHMTLREIKGCFDIYKEEELAVIDDKGKLVDVLEARRFFAHFTTIRFPAEKFPNTQAPIIDDGALNVSKQNLSNLNKFARITFSQNGEDGIIGEIFKRIGFESRVSVEFGAGDGICLSNTRKLILDENFSGIFIEGNPEKAKKGIENYKDFSKVKFIEAYVGLTGDRKLDNILQNLNLDTNPDLISIDIDGYDYHVWDSIKCYRPRVVVIEYNPDISNDIVFINPKREDIMMSSSCAALVELGMKKGYSLAATTACNCIFVVDEEFNKLGIKDNSLAALRPEDTYPTNLWMQTLDRNIYHVGTDRFLWIHEKFSSNKFAVIQD